MKYSNGFYLFQLKEFIEGREIELSRDGYWVQYQSTETYKCYYYYAFDCGFHETPVWFDFKKKYAIIYSINYSIVPTILKGIEEMFYFQCETFEIATSNLFNGTIISEAGFVETNLLKKDKERIELIKNLLGDRC
ncbi:MAG: hypothetical protein JSY10_14825 [Paenibacillus sp.]|nr:hypothetical protein [Paenibacillus sp.]